MSRRETTSHLRFLLIAQLGCPPARIRDDAEFRRDLGADSLDLAEIPALIEEEFGIILSDDEVAFCETVGTAIDLIETKLENRACGTGKQRRVA
jgi:acyl carrier protein